MGIIQLLHLAHSGGRMAELILGPNNKVEIRVDKEKIKVDNPKNGIKINHLYA